MKGAMLKLIAALIALLVPTAALAEPPVWVIRDKDSTITLFGSIHILPRVQWRPKQVSEALAEAEDVWFEIPLDPASQLATSQAATRIAMMPEGQSMLALLDAPTRARLERVAKGLNLPAAYLDKLQPWMVDVALSQAFAQREGGSAAQGVESVLFAEVPRGVKVRAFETGAQQVAILSDLPRASQLATLKETLRQIEEEPGSFDDIVNQWLKADLSGMVKEALDPIKKASPAYYEALITKRNTDWVKQIKQRLAGSGDTLMVVGVGHLVGPDSVPAMLRKQGIKVEGP